MLKVVFNPFTNNFDFIDPSTSSGQGYSGTVANYSALPSASTVTGEFWFVLNSQGTAWLPGSLGGTYYPNGTYYSDGVNWITGISPYQATQGAVNAGIITDQFVSPNTLANWSGRTSGTVTSVSVVTANGISGSVATPTTTPAITLTLQNATTAQAGQLTSTDWNTFNGKGSGSVTSVASADANATFSTPSPNPIITIVAAPKWSTARNLAGNSVDGSANVVFANKFIVQGTSDSGLSATQFLGALSTGILKNTTTTGVLSIAVAGDFPTLNQNTTGSAATLTTARTIGGVSFDGSANITVASATGGFTVSGGDLVLGTNNITLTGSIGATGARVTKGWFTDLQVTNSIAGSITGNAATATALQNARTINGVSFDGTGNITITANITNALSVDNSSLQLDSGTTFDGSAARTISVKALGITNSMLAGSIAYSKLSLTGSIVNGDLAGAVSVAKGGNGLTTVAAGSVIVYNTLDTVSLATSTSGLKALQNNGGTISWVATTGTGNNVFATAPTITGGVFTGATTLALRDTSAAFDLTIGATSSTALTAGRALTIDVVNAARNIKLTGDLTLSGNFTTTGAFNATFSVPQSTTWTLPNTASETLAGLGTAQTFTVKQTFTAATTEMASITLLDTTYKTALDVSAATNLRLGNGFANLTTPCAQLACTAAFTLTSSSTMSLNSTKASTGTAITISNTNSTFNSLTSGTPIGTRIQLGTVAPASGSGTITALSIAGVFSPTGTGTAAITFLSIDTAAGSITQNSTNTGAITYLDINPTITAMYGTSYGIRIRNYGVGTGNGTNNALISEHLGASSFAGTVTMKGFADASSAAAGNVGEVITSSVSTYTNYTTTATYQNITSITLTAGDWDISAFASISSNTSTITAASNAIFVISTTTASASGATEGLNLSYVPQAALLGTSIESASITPYRVTINSTTTYYLNSQATFTVGNPQFVGTIRARRLR